MRFHLILLFATALLSLGQAPPAATPAPAPPPEIDQALRARASAFLQFESEGNFRKAYDLVAEDSKDYYFNTPKQKITSFTIKDIQYTVDFSSATVTSTQKRPLAIMPGKQFEISEVSPSQWKMEKGEWMWFHDPSKDTIMTLLGPLPAGSVSSGPADPAKPSPIPKDAGPEVVAAAAEKIVPKVGVDKKTITFTIGKEAVEEVKFRNHNYGQVQVYIAVSGAPDITVEPTGSLVNAQSELAVKISYKPTTDAPLPTVLEFMLEPFGNTYLLPVKFAPKDSAPKQ